MDGIHRIENEAKKFRRIGLSILFIVSWFDLECGGKVLADGAFTFPIDSITSQSGVAEYLAAALQIRQCP